MPRVERKVTPTEVDLPFRRTSCSNATTAAVESKVRLLAVLNVTPLDHGVRTNLLGKTLMRAPSTGGNLVTYLLLFLKCCLTKPVVMASLAAKTANWH